MGNMRGVPGYERARLGKLARLRVGTKCGDSDWKRERWQIRWSRRIEVGANGQVRNEVAIVQSKYFNDSIIGVHRGNDRVMTATCA